MTADFVVRVDDVEHASHEGDTVAAVLVRAGYVSWRRTRTTDRPRGLFCGMGACQGRFCGLTVTEIIAREQGRDPSDVGHGRLRFPVKPVTLSELASAPVTPDAEEAVVHKPGR